MSLDQLSHDAALTKEEISRRRNLVSDAYRKFPEKIFRAIPDIDELSNSALKRRPTDGTLFQPAITALTEAGILTRKTIGSLMENLNLNHRTIREIARDCGGVHTGAWIADQFFVLAEFSYEEAA